MLINGHHAEELRVAVIEDGVLASYQIEVAEAGLERGNIYRGVVANVQPSLDAAFIDYGNEKHGFLTGHDIVRPACHRHVAETQRRPSVDEILEKGRPILVQVTRDAEGSKGATLTTNLSFPGRYLVLMPFDGAHGLSRKIEDETIRQQLKEKAQSLSVPEGWGYIIRTSAADQTKTALRADLNALLRLSKRVLDEGQRGKGVQLLYDDQDLVVQALRDYLDASIEEVVIDDEKLWQQARTFVDATMPRSKIALTHYQGRVPLFSRHNLEPQIDSIYKRSVPLEGGGSIVIDHTEALTAIDVNSGKNTRGASQEETAYKTNLAAATEVARQLRLRNIGGLVVVDFIDMRFTRHQAHVEKAMRESLKRDKARTSIGRISANGLMEINRQRIRKALAQRMHRTCPTCKGVGLLANPELVGLRLLRRVEARAATGRLVKVTIGLHPELADAIQNQRRRQLAALETEFGITIEIVAATHLHRSDEQIDWTMREGPTEKATLPASQNQPGAPSHRGDEARERAGRRPERAGPERAGPERAGPERAGRPLATVATEEFPLEEIKQVPAQQAAQGTEAPTTQASAPGVGAGDESPDNGGEDEPRTRRRRRRPRRRRRRSGDAARPDGTLNEASPDVPLTAGHAAPDSSAVADGIAEGSAVVDGIADGSTVADSSTVVDGADGAAVVVQDPATASDGVQADADGVKRTDGGSATASRRGRRRRGGRRGPASAHGAAASEPAQPADSPMAVSDGDTAGDAATGADSPNGAEAGKKTSSRRGSRGRTRRARPAAEASTPEGSAAATNHEEAGPAAAEKSPPRRRTPARRRTTRRAPPETPST